MTGEHGNDWIYHRDELNAREKDMEDSIDDYNFMRQQMESLISAYKDNKTAIEKGKDQIAFKVGAAVIATGVAYISGGSYAPAAWIAYSVLYVSIKTYTLDSNEYLNVMASALTAMDTARSNIEAALKGDGNAKGGKGTMVVVIEGVVTERKTQGYKYQYDSLYMPYCAGHLSVRKTWLWDQVNMQGTTGPYYHILFSPKLSFISLLIHSVCMRVYLIPFLIENVALL